METKKIMYKNEYLRKYDSAIELFAEKHELKFISLIDAITEIDLQDGLHPNYEGHKKIFEKIAMDLDA